VFDELWQLHSAAIIAAQERLYGACLSRAVGRLLRDSRPYQIPLERIAELAKRDTPSSVQPKAP